MFSRLTSLAAALLLPLAAVAEKHAQGHAFEKDIAAFEAADKASPPPKGAILFVGDSTFTRWKAIHEDLKGYTVINRGFGGSKMSDLLYFADRVIMPYQPRMIVIQEGGNDIHGGRTPEALMADLQALVKKIRATMPDVPIILGSLTGNPARWGEVEVRKKVNQMYQDFAATQTKVTFLNFFDPFLGPDGKPREDFFVEDHVHPSHAGYELRVKIMKSVLGAPDAK